MPLHKIPLCNLKYVGDIYSSGTFIYKNQQEISKSSPMFLSSKEDKIIEIEKLKCLKMSDNLKINSNIKYFNLSRSKIEITNLNHNSLIKIFEQWGNIYERNKLIQKIEYICKENKFLDYNLNRITREISKEKNSLLSKERFNISKNKNNKLFNKIIEDDFFVYESNYYLDNIIKNMTLQHIQNLSKNYWNIKITNNIFLSEQRKIINKIEILNGYLDRDKYSIDKSVNYLLTKRLSTILNLQCRKNTTKIDSSNLNLFEIGFVSGYKTNIRLYEFNKFLDTRYKNIENNINEEFLNRTYMNIDKVDTNDFLERYISLIYLNNNIEFLNSYKRPIYHNLDLIFLDSSIKNLYLNKLKELFLEIKGKDLNDKNTNLFFTKTYNNIIKNEFLHLVDKRYKKMNFNDISKRISIVSNDIFSYNNIYIIEKSKNLITNYINDNLLNKSYVDFTKHNNKMIGKPYKNFSVNIYNSLSNHVYKNITINNEKDLLQNLSNGQEAFIKENILMLNKNNKTKEMNILKYNEILEAYIKQINKINISSNLEIGIGEANKINISKHLKVAIDEVNNIKTYKELTKHAEEMNNIKEKLVDKYYKSICKDELQLFSKKKKGIEKHNKNMLANKLYTKVNIERYKKLIGKTYIKTNKDINDKNIQRTRPNNMNKNENKELQHIYINEMSNNLYDNMLEKVMPVAEIFKENNVFLDKIIQRRYLFKQTNYLLQHIYQNDAVKHTFNALEYLKQMNISKEECGYLGKYNKDLIYINNNNSLKKYKKDIDKENQKYTEVTERWWVLNPSAPFDRKILPFDYDYSKMPLVSNNNIINTSKIISQHPISFAPYMIDSRNGGKDLNYGTKEIDVSIEIMLDMVNIVGMVILQDLAKFKNCTGQESLEFIVELIFDWLNMDSTIRKMEQNNSREHYLRCYRWIRWESEQLWFEADQDHTIYKNLGIKFAGALLGKLIEYMKYHHFDVVPLWRNLKFMDIERQFNKAKNKDIFKGIDKIKSYRHYMINTQIPTKQHLFQK
ncbi:hypothetical protein CF091_13835 [Clostridium botulinum]